MVETEPFLFVLAEISLPGSGTLDDFLAGLLTGLGFSEPSSPHSILLDEERRGRGGVLEGEEEREGNTMDLMSWNFGSRAWGGRVRSWKVIPKDSYHQS